MLVWLTLPFYDFCGFRSVAVNSVYKLQFSYIYFIICPMLYAIAMGQIINYIVHNDYKYHCLNLTQKQMYL